MSKEVITSNSPESGKVERHPLYWVRGSKLIIDIRLMRVKRRRPDLERRLGVPV